VQNKNKAKQKKTMECTFMPKKSLKFCFACEKIISSVPSSSLKIFILTYFIRTVSVPPISFVCVGMLFSLHRSLPL